MKTSLHVLDNITISEGDQLNGFTFSNGKLIAPKTSGRFVGEVQINEYDAYGRKVFSDTAYNDITLPGSIFMLEQMFKVKATNRFTHPMTNLPTVINGKSIDGSNSISSQTSDNIFNQKVFGFMVGNGGESGGNVIAPDYKTQRLSGFLPFLSYSDLEDTSKYNLDDYAFKVKDGNYTYCYVKKLTKITNDNSDKTVQIFSKWADGSGDINNDELSSDIATPVVAYAQCTLDIAAYDVRNYFGDMNLDNCSINQLGLVAGEPTLDSDGKEEYKDIKLISCVNFKTRDLSNTDNTLKITYKIYCL